MIISRSQAREQGATRYFTGQPCLRGHVAPRTVNTANCVQCQQDYAKTPNGKAAIERSRSKPEQRAKAKEYSAAYHNANRDDCLAKMQTRNRAYYQNKRERIIAQAGEYQAANTEQRNAYKVQWMRERKERDPQFASLLMMRKLVSRTCERIKASRKEIGRTVEVLGYTTEQFRAHIEAQFKDGMTWQNHGAWHVDHIQPLASFNLLDESERKVANSLNNLQPLWAVENMKKGSRPLANLAAISDE